MARQKAKFACNFGLKLQIQDSAGLPREMPAQWNLFFCLFHRGEAHLTGVHPCIILLKVNERKVTLNGEPGTCERILCKIHKEINHLHPLSRTGKNQDPTYSSVRSRRGCRSSAQNDGTHAVTGKKVINIT